MSVQSLAIIGKGAIVGYGTLEATANEEAYTPFLEVFKSDFPKVVTSDVDVTHYLSPNGIKEYIPGWGDAGTVEFEANYRADQQAIIQGLRGIKHEFIVVLPDGTSNPPTTTGSQFVFPGYIKDISGEIPNETKVTCKVAIRVCGAISFVQGS